MVSIVGSQSHENPFWWKEKEKLHQGLLPCELVELSPSFARNQIPNGSERTFHQITKPRRGSMHSEAFSEPVFQKQGKNILPYWENSVR